MFSKNDKISKRQIFRLLSYDILGIGTLLLPSILASLNGTSGWISIVSGVMLSAVFCLILCKVIESMGKGESYPDFIKRGFGKWAGTVILAGYALYYLWLAGYGTYVFGHLIHSNLLKEQSFYWITAGILILGAYGIMQGIEGRARVYEILFWFLMAPLFLMLALAAKNADPFLMFPLMPGDILTKNIWIGGYLVFSVFSVVSFLLFLVPYSSDKKKIKNGSLFAVIFAGVVLIVIYEILLGIFGTKGMAAEEYPAVTLMSMVQIPGGFLERQDAFMVAIWFFTVFAFISSSLFYASNLTKDIIGKKGKKRYIFFGVLVVYAASAAFYRSQDIRDITQGCYLGVGIPFIVIIPILAAVLGKARGKKTKIKK